MSKCPLTGQPCNCSKVFHVTDVVNGVTHSYDVCQTCLQHLNQPNRPPQVTVPDIVEKFFEVFCCLFGGFAKQISPPKPKKLLVEPACPGCGIRFSQIAKTGKVGCPHCYKYFDHDLAKVISLVQGGALQHQGKKPKMLPVNSNGVFDALKAKLPKLVEREEYEKAALVQQAINQLEWLRNQYGNACVQQNNDEIRNLEAQIGHCVNSILQQGILDQ